MSSSTPSIYGIKNCDTMKKAFNWLQDNGIEYTFHDYKKQAVTPELVKNWLKSQSLDELINRRGTTWRKVPEEIRNSLTEEKAIALMCEQPSMIKRPLLVHDGSIFLGFKSDQYTNIFQTSQSN